MKRILLVCWLVIAIGGFCGDGQDFAHDEYDLVPQRKAFMGEYIVSSGLVISDGYIIKPPYRLTWGGKPDSPILVNGINYYPGEIIESKEEQKTETIDTTIVAFFKVQKEIQTYLDNNRDNTKEETQRELDKRFLKPDCIQKIDVLSSSSVDLYCTSWGGMSLGVKARRKGPVPYQCSWEYSRNKKLDKRFEKSLTLKNDLCSGHVVVFGKYNKALDKEQSFLVLNGIEELKSGTISESDFEDKLLDANINDEIVDVIVENYEEMK